MSSKPQRDPQQTVHCVCVTSHVNVAEIMLMKQAYS